MWTYNHNNELVHYGVLGMKWGVRRSPAQLARARGDTTTTNSSKKSSSSAAQTKTAKAKLKAKRAEEKAMAKAKKAEEKAAEKAKKAENEKAKKKTVDMMTDDEIRQAINRLRLEKEYASLTVTEQTRAQKFVNDIVNKVGDTFVNEGIPKVMRKIIDKAVSDKDPEETPTSELMKKSLDKLTDKELDTVINRMRKENEYNDQKNPTKKSKNSKDLKGKNLDDLTDDELADLAKRVENENKVNGKSNKTSSDNTSSKSKNDNDDTSTTSKTSKKNDMDSSSNSKKESWGPGDDGYSVEDSPSRTKSSNNSSAYKAGEKFVDIVLNSDQWIDKAMNNVSNDTERYSNLLESGKNAVAGLLNAPDDD